MPLINCKVELKLKRTKYCVSSAAGNDGTNATPNNICTMKDTKLYVPVVTLSATAKGNQKLSNILVKNLKDQFIGMNIKQKVRVKTQQTNRDIFSNQILLELIDCLF